MHPKTNTTGHRETWPNILQYRVAEVASFIARDSPEPDQSNLRSEVLRPSDPDLVSVDMPTFDPRPSEGFVAGEVESLVKRRRSLLHRPVPTHFQQMGKILVTTEAGLFWGTSQVHNDVLFVDDLPPWDLWLGKITVATKNAYSGQGMLESFLLSWVPPHLLNAMDDVVRLSLIHIYYPSFSGGQMFPLTKSLLDESVSRLYQLPADWLRE